VRELRQAIEVAVLAAPDELVGPEHLSLFPEPLAAPSLPLPMPTARAVERAHILRALVSTAGNKLAAARILGLSRQSLQRRILRHGIALPAESDCPQLDTLPGNGSSAPVAETIVKHIR
jgi:transcriptional regulator of acetoin/glycerol metabolism